MQNFLKQLISFVLPIIVLILVPFLIENNFEIRFIIISAMGLVVLLLGLTIMALTISTFIRIGKGTLAPWSPTRKLITGGMYGYVRNPMIMGVITVLIGESIIFFSINIFLWAIIFYFINNIYFILYEEPDLEKKFGEEYRIYKSNVPRWMPRLKQYEIDKE